MNQLTKHAVAIACALLTVGVVALPPAAAQQLDGSSLKNAKDGLTVNKPAAFQGYTAVSPMNSTSTYLIDMEGRIINEWKSDYTPAMIGYLLPNGHLLRPGAERGAEGARGRGPGGPGLGGPGGRFAPGAGGRIQEFDWEGNLLWDFSFKDTFKDSKLRPHHDVCPLPNGNVLVVCTDPKTKEESIAAGRLPPIAPDELQADAIVEIKPVGKSGGEIVWAWHAWDHLVQEVHKEKPNYSDVSEHPHRIDVNFVTGAMDRILQDPEQVAKLRSLGYVGGAVQPARDDRPANGSGGDGDGRRGGQGGRRGGPGGPGGGGDWMHVNSIAYNAKLDQIMISIHEFSEVWIIDHSTTTKEAASSSGGKYGKGGDLLYRWGNPKAYRNGTNADQRLFGQHSAHWIAEGLPGAGNMLLFNNGLNRPDGAYSTVDEIELPYDAKGGYTKEEYVAFAPLKAKWSYGSKQNSNFYSMLISGAQRLPNGNTFVCSGTQGLLFEVTPDGEIAWQYKHPGGGFGGGGGGFGGPGAPGPSMLGGLVPDFLAGMLGVDEAQRTAIKSLQEHVDAKLKSLLTETQHAKLNSDQTDPGPGAGGFSPPKVGEVISEAKRKELELTDDQSASLIAFQKEITTKLNDILTEDQRKQIANFADVAAQGGPPGGFVPPPGGGPPGGFGGPGGFGARGGGRGGRGGPGGIFRSLRYATDYPGLQGKEMKPGKKLEEVAAAESAPGNRGTNRGRPQP